MIKKIFRRFQTFRLYARIGLKNLSFLKIYRMLRYWFLCNILKKEIPWVVELSVTYRCQCRCHHCSVSNYLNEAKGKPELTFDEIRTILQDAAKIGIPKVDYFGGEPLLRKDIVELVHEGSRLGLYMSMTTNAALLDEEMVKKLKHAGISCINISLDSTKAEVHDSYRGTPGLFNKAVEAIKLCHKYGIACIASTYVTRENILGFGSQNDTSDLRKIIDFSKSIKASGIRILFPILSGEWIDCQDKGFTQVEELQVINNIDYSFAFIEGAYSVQKSKKVCQSLRKKMFNISPYGDVQLCIAFTNVFANLKEKPLKQALNTMYTHPVYLNNENRTFCSTRALEKNPD